MKPMSFSETIFLFFLALIIFGPKKLPEIARQVGKYMNEFRRASNEFKAQIEQEISNLELENKKQTILPPSPPPEGTASRTLTVATNQISPAESPAAPAVVEDEPLFAAVRTTEPATAGTEVPPTSPPTVISPSQESHG